MRSRYFFYLTILMIISCRSIEAHEIVGSETTEHVLPLILGEQEVFSKEKYPEYLYKILSIDNWQESLLHDRLILSSEDNAFIHFSKEDQVGYVVQKFWNQKDYVLLKVASSKLSGRLVYETNPGGINKYYHLYEGSIPLEAVVGVEVIHHEK